MTGPTLETAFVVRPVQGLDGGLRERHGLTTEATHLCFITKHEDEEEKKRKDRTCSIQVCCSNKIKRWRRVDADYVTSALSDLVLVVHTDHLGLWSVFRAQG